MNSKTLTYNSGPSTNDLPFRFFTSSPECSVQEESKVKRTHLHLKDSPKPRTLPEVSGHRDWIDVWVIGVLGHYPGPLIFDTQLLFPTTVLRHARPFWFRPDHDPLEPLFVHKLKTRKRCAESISKQNFRLGLRRRLESKSRLLFNPFLPRYVVPSSRSLRRTGFFR